MEASSREQGIGNREPGREPESQTPKSPGQNAGLRILILALPHGGGHQRAAKALRTALREIRPEAVIEVVDALDLCTRWFRAYYDSYLIPLRFWPSLWGWIESLQHQSKSTGPTWLYRRGVRPLFRFIESFNPDVVVATEVGLCEFAALHKRELKGQSRLVGVELMDFNQAWVQPEVDLYLTTHRDLAEELAAAGAPPAKIVTTGQPIDPVFACLPGREVTRARLGVEGRDPVLLVLFGGAGFGNPAQLLREVRQVRQPLRVVIIAGRNPRLEGQIRKLCGDDARFLVLGWVDNMHEWMVAADLLVTKPGGSTLMEAFACGLPTLVIDPLPGNERRTCQWIERWGAGYWVKRPADLAPTIASLVGTPASLEQFRRKALAMARPHAARDAAQAILDCWERAQV